MTCSINFTINPEGKLKVKAKWNKENPKNVARFRKLLLHIQAGSYNMDICEAIIKHGEDTMDKKNARRILKVLVPKETYEDEPILFPQELGQEINGND